MEVEGAIVANVANVTGVAGVAGATTEALPQRLRAGKRESVAPAFGRKKPVNALQRVSEA
jgi:hypothetical protein